MTGDLGSVTASAKGEVSISPELSVIIVSYETAALTLRCIQSALSQHDPSLEVIVVDNASTDGTVAAISRTFPQVRLISLGSNVGFARANNLGACHARGRFLLLLNPDAVALPGAFAEITEFALLWPHATIWGGRVVNADGSTNPRSCGRRPTLWSVVARAAGLGALWPGVPLFNSEAMPGWERDEMRHVDIVVGCFLLIRRADWQQLGGFDPAYFMYGEDVDLCLRAARVGGRPAITPRAMIMHVEGASQPRGPREVQILAARIRYLRKHLPQLHRIPAIWAVRLGIVLRLMGYLCVSPVPRYRPALIRMRHVWDNRDLWWNGYVDLSAQAPSDCEPDSADTDAPTWCAQCQEGPEP